MFAHYLTSALRNLRRYKVHSLINVVGLSLGFACFMAAWLFIDSARRADTQFANSDRIYVIYQRSEVRSLDLDFPLDSGTSWRVAEQLRTLAPELEAVARLNGLGQEIVSVDGEPSYRQVRVVEPEFLEIFDLPFIAGSPGLAAGQSRAAFLTSAAAEGLFGGGDAVGRSLELEDRGEIEVAGVLGPLPEPSHLTQTVGVEPFEILIVSNLAEDFAGPQFPWMDGDNMSWLFTSVTTYALFPEGGSFEPSDLVARLQPLTERVPPEIGVIEFDVRPVSTIAMSNLNGAFFFNRPWLPISAMILLLGGVVLATSCVNFIGLSTAVAAFRAKEVGMRKVLGAKRGQIVMQQLTEAALVVVVSFGLGLAILQVFAPLLNDLVPVGLEIPWSSATGLWLSLAVLATLVTLFAGGYPALVLGRVRPVMALGGGAAVRAGLMRKLLVGAQFAIASFLLISVVIIQSQNSALYRRSIGLTDDVYVVIQGQLREAGTTFDLLRSELLRAPQILAVTAAGTPPWAAQMGGTSFAASPDEAAELVFTQQRSVTYDYFQTFGIELLAGRWFSINEQDRARLVMDEFRAAEEAAESDPDALDSSGLGSADERRVAVLNRAAIEQFGWTDPEDAIGGFIYDAFPTSEGHDATPVEIIGVIDEAPFGTVGFGYDAFVYYLSHPDDSHAVIRIAPEDIPGALAHIDAVWAELAPETPLRRQFLDERFEQLYEFFARISRGIMVLAICAIVITNMGLFGMATFVTQRRRREVGIRKSLGATSKEILRLFVADFSKPILIASVIAWPLAYLAGSAYLNIFVERIPLTPVPFLLSLAAMFAIAWLAIASQVLGAARLKPAEVLRYE